MLAGHRADRAAAAGAVGDADPGVRAAALSALGRCGPVDPALLVAAMGDPAPTVRRRACDLAAAPADPATPDPASADCATPDPASPDPGTGAGMASDAGAALDAALVRALEDPDPLVVEAACWALGERGRSGAVGPLAAAVAAHPDPRCREAAVAAIGAIGHPTGLPAILAALHDRPSVRRRATVALAAFDGPEVDQALQLSAADRDWQVREVAQILLDPPV